MRCVKCRIDPHEGSQRCYQFAQVLDTLVSTLIHMAQPGETPWAANHCGAFGFGSLTRIPANEPGGKKQY